MTKDKALRLALEALEKQIRMANGWQSPAEAKAITAIKGALAQDELCSSQEPWMYRIWNDKDAQWRLTNDCSWPAEPIYTTPQASVNEAPKRPWVGLTDDEILAIGKELGMKCRLGGNQNIDFDYARANEHTVRSTARAGAGCNLQSRTSQG